MSFNIIMDSLPELTGEQVKLTPEMARKLNEDEFTTVLDYKYDTPEKLLSMEEVTRILQETRAAYSQARAAHPDKGDAQIREDLIASHKDVAVFSRTHPTIFIKATSRDITPVLFERLHEMIQIRAQQERGALSNAQTACAVETALKKPLK